MLRRFAGTLLGGCGMLLAVDGVRAQAIPIDAFARLPAIGDVSLSPDGHRVAYVSECDGKQCVVTHYVAERRSTAILRNDEATGFVISWCHWANDTRLLCGIRASTVVNDGGMYVTRLVAMNADGSEFKVLMQGGLFRYGQILDQIVDWTPDAPDTVLVEADPDRDTFPAVYEMDVRSGAMKMDTRARPPIREFTSDRRGRVRLGFGYQGANIYYFARRQGEDKWRQLEKFEAFSREPAIFRPLAVIAGSDTAYATGTHQGREALWELDLAEQKPPELLVHHPGVDIEHPLFTEDGQLVAIQYEAEKPAVYYLDERAENVVKNLGKALPGTLNRILGMSRDEKVYLVYSGSDVESAYSVVNIATPSWEVTPLGRAYPELEPTRLAHMKPIEYPATDGTRIPGYLTLPPGEVDRNLPLVVLPHGGPIARDTWSFDFLVQFLASRGYAVLQMNFRGSSGYGRAWFGAAHQDWGGLTYSDIRDGARWAVAEGIADPARVAIVGWSFGGYAALLGAARDPDLYRCAVSIAGVSDLITLKHDASRFAHGDIAGLQIGQDRAKLKQDSPRRLAQQIKVPILLVHGTHDFTVEIEQARLMATALKKAGAKDYELIELENADHQLWRTDERRRLLTALEGFLAKHLAVIPTTAANAE